MKELTREYQVKQQESLLIQTDKKPIIPAFLLESARMLPSPPVSFKEAQSSGDAIDEETLANDIDSLVEQLEASLVKLEQTEAEKKHWETTFKFASDQNADLVLPTKIKSTLDRVTAHVSDMRLTIRGMAQRLNHQLDQFEHYMS